MSDEKRLTYGGIPAAISADARIGWRVLKGSNGRRACFLTIDGHELIGWNLEDAIKIAGNFVQAIRAGLDADGEDAKASIRAQLRVVTDMVKDDDS